MASDNLWLWTATELAESIRTGDISAIEVTEAHLDRIQAVNDQVNAIVTLEPQLALDQAKQIDKARAKGQPLGPLAGVPMAHKDLTLTKGIRTTFGSRRFETFIPNKDAVIIERLKQAGAVSLGKTNTSEWGAGSQTFNSLYGTTRNPYDLTKTCGGSSGGAAAALAARMVPLCDGSDLGGSLRNPASFCNIVGFRTTAGRVPIVPSDNPDDPLPIAGPMARNIDDCALLLGVMAGVHPEAPLSDLPPLACKPPIKPLTGEFKIALSADFGQQLPVEPEVADLIEKQSRTLTDAGFNVEPTCPELNDAGYAFHILRAAAFARRHGEGVRTRPEDYKSTIIWNVEAGLGLQQEEINWASAEKLALQSRFLAFFETYDFLLTPTVQVLPFNAQIEYVTEINGIEMQSYIDWMQSCSIISLTGFPALSLPVGFSRQGLPVGVQIIGKPHAETAVLQLAKTLELHHPVWRQLPKL
ncbi:MAG: amidase family protein [Proteobacteria bacterium]|nr:amidase family protein [Pseudomonadota bacterium]MDA1206382.1 amidase family protein [Pseudomonadota bacterium]